MRVVVDRKAMVEAFGLAASVCKPKSPKPILRHVLMTASESGATLCGTDLELYVRVPVAGCVAVEPGRAVLDGEKVKAALESYPDEQVRIETDGSKVLVAGGRSKASLASDEPDLFPAMPDFPEGSPSWSIAPADLAMLTDRTSFSIDPKSTRYALGGCKLEFAGASLGSVGCDGRRMTLMHRPAEGQISDIKAIVPVEALKRAGAIFGKEAGTVLVAFSGGNPVEPNLCHMRGPSGELVTRLVEGRYPPYRDVFPGDPVATAKVPVGAFRSAVRCAAIVTSEATRGVDLAFRPGELTVSASAADSGESDATVDAEYDGPAMTVTADARYLRDALSVLDESATLSVALIDPETAMVFRLEDGWSHVLMPMTRER